MSQTIQAIRRVIVRAAVLAAVGAVLSVVAPAAQADEPGAMSEKRWKELSEVQFAELKAAEDMFRKKNYKAARNLYEKFMSVHTKVDAAIYCQLMIAETTRLSGKPKTAVSEFQFVRDLAPDHDDAKWAQLRIGQCYRTAGDVEKAMQVYMDIFKDNGTHITAFTAALEQVAILEGQGKLRERVPVWEDFVERFQKNRLEPRAFHGAVTGLAREKMRAGQIDRAYDLYAMVEKTDKAQRSLIDAGASVVGELARSKDKAEVTRAEQIANTIADKAMGWLRDDKDRPGYQEMTSSVISILMTIGRPDDALKHAVNARKLYAEAQWTVLLHTELLQKLNKLDQAIAVASEARKYHKDPDWALDLYANLLLEKEDVNGAISAWDLMKNKIAALTNSSEALAKAKKIDDAIARRRKIMEIDPTTSSETYMWIGNLLAKAGKYQEAINEFNLAQNEPKNLYEIAECLSKMKKYKDAIEQLTAIGAAFEAETPHAIYCIALELEKMGQTENAIKRLRQVCRSFPKSRAASAAHVRLQSKYKIDETLGGDTGEKKE